MDEEHQAYKKMQNTKKARQHKKQMYINLKNQMEFYFSPSNLSKDRFLAKKIDEDPCK
jgi:La-related protein 7